MTPVHWRECGKFGRLGDTSLRGCIFCIQINSCIAVLNQGMVCLQFNADLQYLTLLVLYCHADRVWKLTDYVFSRESPVFAGFPSTSDDYRYCAPEFLKQGPFTSEVDIWSLGCIMYELVTLQKVASRAVRNLGFEVSGLRMSVIASSNFLRDHMTDNICDLLQNDPGKRPTISLVDRIFASYCGVLEIPSAQALCDAPSYPLYQDWKAVIENYLLNPPVLHQLALKEHEEKGHKRLATSLQCEMIHRYADDESSRRSQSDSETRWQKGQIQKLQPESEYKDGFNKSMLYRLGALLVEKAQYREACAVYRMTEECI